MDDERTNPTSWLFLVQVSILHDSPHSHTRTKCIRKKRVAWCRVHSFAVITYFIITNSKLAFFFLFLSGCPAVPRSHFFGFYSPVVLRARHSNTFAWYTSIYLSMDGNTEGDLHSNDTIRCVLLCCCRFCTCLARIVYGY